MATTQSATNCTAWSSVIQKRVMRSSVTVSSPDVELVAEERDDAASRADDVAVANAARGACRACRRTRSPARRASRRTASWRRRGSPGSPPCRCSARRHAGRLASMQASATFWVPRMLVLIASKGLYSQTGTCLSAAAWMTTSTPSMARRSRSRSRTSPMKKRSRGSSNLRSISVCLSSSRLKMRMAAGFHFAARCARSAGRRSRCRRSAGWSAPRSSSQSILLCNAHGSRVAYGTPALGGTPRPNLDDDQYTPEVRIGSM